MAHLEGGLQIQGVPQYRNPSTYFTHGHDRGSGDEVGTVVVIISDHDENGDRTRRTKPKQVEII